MKFKKKHISKRSRIANIILKTKSEDWQSLTLIKTYYKATLIECSVAKSGQINQRNRAENPDIGTH